MILSNWNLYLANHKSKGGRSSGPERKVIYISKDKLKTGNSVNGYRLDDKLIYEDKIDDI
jgi:hypothetical protein